MKKIIRSISVAALLGAACSLPLTASALTSILKETDIEGVAIKLARETAATGYQLITMEEVKKMIDAKEDFVLVDAHPKWEFDMGYIEGALHFGFQSNMSGKWAEDVTLEGATQDDYRKLLGSDMDKKIVIYCGFTKCGRSHNAATWAVNMGYTNVLRAPGGITAWKDLGYPYKVTPNDANAYPNK